MRIRRADRPSYHRHCGQGTTYNIFPSHAQPTPLAAPSAGRPPAAWHCSPWSSCWPAPPATYFLLVQPVDAARSPRSRGRRLSAPSSPARWRWSRVDGTTYRVDIRYHLSGGREPARVRTATTSGSGSRSGTARKQAIVDRYPPGARVPCWFDPGDPAEAVLSRGFSPAYLFGPDALCSSSRSARRPLVWRSSPAAARRDDAGGYGRSLALRSSSTRGRRPARPSSAGRDSAGRVLGLTLLALFWNGIVSVFVWQAVHSWRQGQPDGCLTVFLIPFVLVGLGLIFAVVRQFLVLFNPRLHITLMPGELTRVGPPTSSGGWGAAARGCGG